MATANIKPLQFFFHSWNLGSRFLGHLPFRDATRRTWKGGTPARGGTKDLNFPPSPSGVTSSQTGRAPVGEENVLIFLGNLFQNTRDSKNNPDRKGLGWGKGVSYGWARPGAGGGERAGKRGSSWLPIKKVGKSLFLWFMSTVGRWHTTVCLDEEVKLEVEFLKKDHF